MELVAYNYNDVHTRNLLAIAGEDNILSETLPCTAYIEITSAYFKSQYNGPTCLPRPYMEMSGFVNGVFIEEDDDRYFPSGTKNITLANPQEVRVRYNLAESELQELVGMGLYREGFDVPENLIGNTMEIPLVINYKAIYDTPCCIVEIADAYELETSSFENNYFGIFNGCKIHPEIIAEQQAGITYSSQNERLMSEEYDNEYDSYEDELVEEEEFEDIDDMTIEEKEDEEILSQFAETMSSHLQQQQEDKKRKRDEQGGQFNAKEFMRSIREEIESEESEVDESQNLYDWNSDGQSVDAKDKKKKKVDAYERIKQKINRNVDIALDNKALNEGRDDISGFGASETPGDKAEKKTPNSNSNQKREGINLAQTLLGNASRNNNGPQFL